MAERKRIAPYAPASTVSEFFDHIRYVREPDVVDAGLLRDYGIKESHVFALISALKFLGLTDDSGKPTPIFRELQTGGDEFKDTLRGVIERAYEDLLTRLDVSRDSKDKIVNFFARNYSPATADRAARLFLDLCGEAGIATAAQPRARVRRAQGAPPKAGERKKARSPVQENGQTDQHDAGPRIDIRINSQDLANMEPSQIAAIFEGLAKLSARAELSRDDGESAQQEPQETASSPTGE